ncbi:MAG: hypothetical protein INR68_17100 [Methylobacterium mesophilicum]|nr:hypothetical protein [Methylobacterium mesophilicum]
MKVLKRVTQIDMRPDELDRMVDDAIALADGDRRRAIRGLILGQRALRFETVADAPVGQARGRLH